MEDKDILKLNKLVNLSSEEFGLDMTVEVDSISEPLMLQVGVRGIGVFNFKEKEALLFIHDPALALAKKHNVSKSHLLAFYSANNNDLNRCQSLTKKGTRCTRVSNVTVSGISDYVPQKVYLCHQHEERAILSK
ncbi:hypothetical protein [Alteromonas sp. MB-3u-76]|uniref:hypothetical protein n=1 Tax=Alteromonas sp. MB-3u-76 TaxID=2058133 RepID=UPI0012FD5450|nr:hypothetical protein [Alteromonas sp. MB-3u-76]